MTTKKVTLIIIARLCVVSMVTEEGGGGMRVGGVERRAVRRML